MVFSPGVVSVKIVVGVYGMILTLVNDGLVERAMEVMVGVIAWLIEMLIFGLLVVCAPLLMVMEKGPVGVVTEIPPPPDTW